MVTEPLDPKSVTTLALSALLRIPIVYISFDTEKKDENGHGGTVEKTSVLIELGGGGVQQECCLLFETSCDEKLVFY